MEKSIVKILATLLIVSLNWTGLLAIGKTLAYFNDTENSLENTYQAATLDFAIVNNNIEELIGVELGEDIEFISILMKMTGSLDIQYNVYAEKMSGNPDFCNALQLGAFHSSIFYNGALLSFSENNITSLGTWAFEIKLPHTSINILHGEECNVDLVFQGWRDDVPDFNQSGFTDEERIHLRLTSRMIVLNEFLPRPDGVDYGFNFGDDDSDMPQGEWVELYNNSDYSFDLAGWYIKDSLESDTNKIMITGSNTVPAGAIIGSKSWLVVYMNKAVLNNNGDTVKLFDNANILIDSYTYTSHDYCELEPTPGDENSYTIGGGSCGEVPPNKSYARIPDGIGYWVDPMPTPGGPNRLEPFSPSDLFAVKETLNQEEIPEEIPEVPEVSIIETATPSSEETVTIPEPIIEATTPSIEEVIVVEEEPQVENQESEIMNQESDETLINEPEKFEEVRPLENSDEEAVRGRTSNPQPEPSKEPDPEPEPEPEPELNNDDNIENEQNNNEQEENI